MADAHALSDGDVVAILKNVLSAKPRAAQGSATPHLVAALAGSPASSPAPQQSAPPTYPPRYSRPNLGCDRLVELHPCGAVRRGAAAGRAGGHLLAANRSPRVHRPPDCRHPASHSQVCTRFLPSVALCGTDGTRAAALRPQLLAWQPWRPPAWLRPCRRRPAAASPQLARPSRSGWCVPAASGPAAREPRHR